MLTHSCGYCDSSGFAQKGGDAYRKRLGTFIINYMQYMEPKETEPTGGNPKETTKTKPEETKPVKKAASSVFDLGNL